MSTSCALWIKEKRGPFVLENKPVPIPGPGDILVKEISAALNPIDWKIQTYGIVVPNYPTILGRDGAGEVVAVGEGVTQFQIGDRVLHQGQPSNSNGDYGAFQKYALASADIVSKIPSNITFDQAASIPLGFGTAAIPIYSPSPAGADLIAPWDGGRGKYEGQPVLVFGGSSSVGQLALQLARLSGFSPIISTASLSNTDLLLSRGATHVIDRHLPPSKIASTIASITTKPIRLVYDAVSSAATQQLGYDSLAEGGHILVVNPPWVKETPGSTKKVLHVNGSVYFPANKEFGRRLAQNLSALLESGDIVHNPIEVVPGGLNGVVPGLERLKKSLVSGRKLIVHPGETV